MDLMKKYRFFIFTGAISLLGFLMLKFSTDLGVKSADSYLMYAGGSLDTDLYNFILAKYVLSNIIIGVILLFVGVTFLCFAIYKLPKEKEQSE